MNIPPFIRPSILYRTARSVDSGLVLFNAWLGGRRPQGGGKPAAGVEELNGPSAQRGEVAWL